MNERKKIDAINEALRNEPDYRELVETLKKQTPHERKRFTEWAEDEERREGNFDVAEEDPQDT